MIYNVEVQRLYDIDGEEIGIDIALYKRDEQGDLIDLLVDHEHLLNDNEIEDRDFIVEKDFTNLEVAIKEFQWQKETLLNYLD